PLHKSCAEWIFLNVKPFVVQRFTRAQQPIETARCYFQEGFSSWRIQRFNAAEKFPSLASRSFVGATMTCSRSLNTRTLKKELAATSKRNCTTFAASEPSATI